MASPDVKLLMVDRFGAPYANGDLAGATWRSWGEKLNGHGPMSFTIQTTDPQAVEVTEFRDIQLWRDGELKWWGIPVRASEGPDLTTWQCVSLEWLMSHAVVGPNDVELLANGGFESGTSGWTAEGATIAPATSPVLRGAGAMRITNGSSSLFRFAHRTFSYTSPLPAGSYEILHVPAWYYLESLTAPAPDERGILAACFYPTGVTYHYNFARISSITPIGRWLKAMVTIKVPTGVTSQVQAQLYGGVGSVVWDEVRITRDGGVGSKTPVEVRTLLSSLVSYVTAERGFNFGFAGPNTGRTEARWWAYHEDANIGAIFADYACRDIADWWVAYGADGRSRTVNIASPRRGTYRPEHKLEVGRNITSWSRERAGDQSVNRWRVNGHGQGPAREFAIRSDASTLGGYLIDGVASIDADAPLVATDDLAISELARTKVPPRVPSVTAKTVTVHGDLTTLHPGDTTGLGIRHGAVQEEGDRRVVALEHRNTPDGEETAVVLN